MSGRAHDHTTRPPSPGCGLHHSSSNHHPARHHVFSRLVLLCLLSMGLYINSSLGEFVFDDHKAILNNPDVRLDTPLSTLLSNDFWGNPLNSSDSHKSFRPITTLTFRWNRQLHGLNPAGYHLSNVILHSIVCMLLYIVLTEFSINKDTGLMASLLFAVHPIHTEAVSNIVGRAEILSALFYLLSIYSFLKFTHCYTAGKCYHLKSTITCVLWAGCVPVFALLAMFSKEQGITSHGVCMGYWLFNWWSSFSWKNDRSKFHFPRKEFAVLAYLIMSLLIILSVRLSFLSGQVPVFTPLDNPASFSSRMSTRILTYLYVCSFNVWLLLFPSNLCFDWSVGSIPLVESMTDLRLLWTLVVFILIIGCCYYCCISNNNDPIITRGNIFFGLLLLVVPFLPSSNLFYTVGFVVAERVLYLPSMGFCLLIGIGMKRILETNFKFLGRFHLNCGSSGLVVVLMSTMILFTMSVKTVVRNTEWRDMETLAFSGLRVNSNNAKIYVTIGNLLVEKGDLQCEFYYKEALRLYPNYTMAWSNLGLVYINTERPTQAKECYLEALTIQPNHINANTNMGHYYRLHNRWKEAVNHFTIASNRSPNDPSLYYYLGQMYMKLGDKQQAEKKFKEALNVRVNYPEVYVALGYLLLSPISRKSEAITHLHKELDLLPDSVKGHLHLGVLLFNKKEYAAAEPHLIFSVRQFLQSNKTAHVKACTLLIELYRNTGNSVAITQDFNKLCAQYVH